MQKSQILSICERLLGKLPITHRGRVTHIGVGKLTKTGSDKGLSPGRSQTIISTHVEILLIGPWGTNFSDISIDIYTLSFTKMHWKMSSGKWRPFFLNDLQPIDIYISGKICLKCRLQIVGTFVRKYGYIYLTCLTVETKCQITLYCDLRLLHSNNVKLKSRTSKCGLAGAPFLTGINFHPSMDK